MSELKPCPFCGSTEHVSEMQRSRYNYLCLGCGACGPQSSTLSGVTERWNVRITAEESEISRLQAQVEDLESIKAKRVPLEWAVTEFNDGGYQISVNNGRFLNMSEAINWLATGQLPDWSAPHAYIRTEAQQEQSND